MTVNAPDVTATYDGAAHGIVVNVTDPSSGYTIKYGDSADSCTQDESPTITNVSDSGKTAYFRITAANYEDYTGSANITIRKKPVKKVSGIKAENKDYDGNKTAVLDCTDVKFDGETVAGLSVTASGEFADADAGKNKTVNISILDLQGTSAPNYELAESGKQTTTTADISKVNIPADSITDPKAITGLTYEGAALALVTGGTIAGKIGTMWYTVTDGTAMTAPEFDGDSKASDKKWSTSVPTAINAGTYYVWYRVDGGKNYKDIAAAKIPVTISKAAARTLTDVTQKKSYQSANISVSLAGKMPSDAGTLTFAKGGEASKTGSVSVSGWSVNSAGDVDLEISGGATGDTITLPVTIASTNYEDSTVNVVVNLVNKTEAGITFTEVSPLEVPYSEEAIELHAAASNTGDNAVWTWASSNESVATVDSDGVLTIKGCGSTSITVDYESDTTIGQAIIVLTVNKIEVEIPTAVSGLKWTGSEQTGVEEGEGYTVTDGKAVDVGSYTATATLTDTVNHQWSDGRTEAKHISWSIGKADGPAAPAGLKGVAPTADGNDGRITGVTTDMEYSEEQGFSTAVSCTGTEITGLTAGTYYVRIKETATNEAGESTSVVVPEYNAPAPETFAVEVINGKGSGSYEEGASVTISANDPPEGKAFDKWTSEDGVEFADAASPETSFKMPGKDVTVTATYKDKEADKPGTDDPRKEDDSGQDDPKPVNPDPGKTPEQVPDKVPVTNPSTSTYASPEDNFAPVAPGSSEGTGGNIKKLELDFSNVKASGVDPSGLKMTAISGSKFTTKAKVKDKNSVTTEGGVKAKFNKKDSTVSITCKRDGKAIFETDDGTYAVEFKVEKPKPNKDEGKIQAGSGPVTKTVKDLFGTSIAGGKLTVLKEKVSGQATLSGNSLTINPTEKDTIKVQYQYLNKKYKMSIKVK